MWTKIIFALFLVLFIFAGIFFVRDEDETSSKQPQTQERVSPVREAKNIVMYEKRLDSDWVFVIRAQLLLQETNETFTLMNFRMDRTDGLKIVGRKAQYNSEASLLKVTGPMTVITADGWRADLTDLIWDRSKQYAVTDNPVKLQGGKGTLRGNRAEFFDDFNQIVVSGDVHARVYQNAVNDFSS